MKRAPSFQFYPADWKKDLELQSCSIEARGLWIELMCIMHEANPYGTLVINGRSPTKRQVGNLVGVPLLKYSKLVQELIDNGVAKIDKEGRIYSKRMIEDHKLRMIRQEAGYKGGNPILLKQKVNQDVKGEVKRNQTPSSSISSSSSEKDNTNVVGSPVDKFAGIVEKPGKPTDHVRNNPKYKECIEQCQTIEAIRRDHWTYEYMGRLFKQQYFHFGVVLQFLKFISDQKYIHSPPDVLYRLWNSGKMRQNYCEASHIAETQILKDFLSKEASEDRSSRMINASH